MIALKRLRARGARSRIVEVAEGTSSGLDLDLVTRPEALVDLLDVARKLPRSSQPVRRLRRALDSRTRGLILELLAAPEAATRRQGARLCGALQLEEAVPWLELLLDDSDHRVREAAARALGRIGGGRSADALLGAYAYDQVPWFRLTVELAKAAPHLYLEQALADTFWAHERPALITAIVLRHPAAGGADFLATVPVSGPRDLIAVCHVLARAGTWAPVSWVAALLDHPDRRVRAAADRALRRIRTAGSRAAQAPVFVVAAGSA